MAHPLYPIKKALVSVYDKQKLDVLGRFLKEQGTEVYSTGGTAEYLRENAGIEVITIESVTGFPEMMDGRVKTLHPKVFGGILARRSESRDLEEATQHQIPLFDLIVVNLYPFWDHRQKAYDAQASFIDIGGPSMLRAAAKNCAAVTVLSSPDDYEPFIAEVTQHHGSSFEFRYRMAGKTFERTAQYDALIAEEWNRHLGNTLPSALSLSPQHVLRYGENPHQKASWSGPLQKNWVVLQGKELSYNNLLDVEAATRLVQEFALPSCVIVKHNNPCGVAAFAGTTASVFKTAFECDSKSAFGGVVAINQAVDEDAANEMAAIFLEVVLAPSFTEGAKSVLAQKKNLRLIEWPKPTFQPYEVRSALGGWLVQDMDTKAIPDSLKTVTKTTIPSDSVLEDLKFAWLVCKHVRSNAIVIAKAGRTLGIGAGQMSRVDAVQIALQKLDKNTCAGAVLASDAFFPFRDNIDLLKDSGVQYIIQPGGSQRDAEVIQACDEHGIAMVLTGERHFRH